MPNQEEDQANNEREQRRKYRVEKKLQELNETQEKEQQQQLDDVYYDMTEYAKNHFNSHERSPEGTLMATLTRKRQSSEMIPKEDMVKYHKGSTIPNSHIHMYDPDNVNIACHVFRVRLLLIKESNQDFDFDYSQDLCKYIRGELNNEKELHVIQTIIGNALEREELRDEVFVQCIRQATDNPNPEWTERVWLLLCLCVVSFQPSKILNRYFVSFLKTNLQQNGRIVQYVQWCLDNCNNNKITIREKPPSSVEIAVSQRIHSPCELIYFIANRQ